MAETRKLLDAPAAARVKLLTEMRATINDRLLTSDPESERHQAALRDLAKLEALEAQVMSIEQIAPGVERVSEGLTTIGGARLLPKAKAR